MRVNIHKICFMAVIAVLPFMHQLPVYADVQSMVKRLASPKQIERWAVEVEFWSVDSSAITDVLPMLKDADPKIRIAAAEALWHLRNRDAIVPLKDALSDTDPKVVTRIKEILNRFDPRHEPEHKTNRPEKLDSALFNTMIASNDEQKQMDAMGLIPAGTDPEVFDLAVQLIKHKNKRVASEAASILCRFTDGRSDPYLLYAWKHGNEYMPGIIEYPGAKKLALIMMKSTNPQRRIEASGILKDLQDPECMGVLKAALSDKSASVRQNAADGLGRFEDRSVIPILLKALKDPDEEVRNYATSSLGDLKSHEALTPVIELLNSKKTRELSKFFYIAALEQIADPKAVPALMKCLKSSEWNTKEMAISALAHFKVKKATPQICKALKDDEGLVRGEAARALGELGDPKTADYLLSALKDKDTNVRAAAMLSLARLKDKRAYAILIKMADECKPGIGLYAAAALGTYKDKRAYPHIIPYLTNTYSPSAYAISYSLVSLGDERAIKPLISAITRGWNVPHNDFECGCEQPDTGIAAKTIMELNTPEGNEFLLKCLEERNLPVVKGAYRFFINQGIEGSEETIITAMHIDSLYIAKMLINSGNSKLMEAGQKYLHTHHEDVYLPFDKTGCPKWGSKQPATMMEEDRYYL